MRFRNKAGLVLATMAAALVGIVPGAFAQTTDWEIAAAGDPTRFCREVQLSAEWETVCVEVGRKLTVGTGATVAPSVRVTCGGTVATCFLPSVGVGTTGFMANPAFPLPEVRPGGTLYHPGGVVGTAYANGSSVSVAIPNFCIGDPYYCPGGGLRVPVPSVPIATD